MNTAQIIQQIDAEIAKLQQARSLLSGVETQRKVGRPKKSGVVSRILAVIPARKKLSAEGRARIAAAQKARWAAKTSAKKADAKLAKL